MRFIKHSFVLLLALCMLLLGACTVSPGGEKSVTRTVFAMDTVMDITPYGPNAKEAASQAAARIAQLEQEFSVTIEDSDISAVNRANGRPVTVSQDTSDLIAEALTFCEATNGALDITIYPVLKAWGFTTGEYRVPDPDELKALQEQVDYAKVQLSGDTVSVPAGMEIDLGSVAKGYTGDQIMQIFRDCGVKSGILSLGGNVQALGAKPDGSPWRVAIQNPKGEGYVGVLNVEDEAVVTSGGYERYFEQDGRTYWHILDPATGAPAESGVISASIVSKSGVQCDALSTALFILGPDAAERLWRERGDFDYLLVLDNGTLVISEGIVNRLELTDDWSQHEQTVVKR